MKNEKRSKYWSVTYPKRQIMNFIIICNYLIGLFLIILGKFFFGWILICATYIATLIQNNMVSK